MCGEVTFCALKIFDFKFPAEIKFVFVLIGCCALTFLPPKRLKTHPSSKAFPTLPERFSTRWSVCMCLR